MNNRARVRMLQELVKANEGIMNDLIEKGCLGEQTKGYLTGKIEAYKNVIQLLEPSRKAKAIRIRIAVVEEPKLWENEEQVLDVLLDTLDGEDEE